MMAYELRISYWSLDVCSSDHLCGITLLLSLTVAIEDDDQHGDRLLYFRAGGFFCESCGRKDGPHDQTYRRRAEPSRCRFAERRFDQDRKSTRLNSRSLMRISYAVFCLKKTIEEQQITHKTTITKKMKHI